MYDRKTKQIISNEEIKEILEKEGKWEGFSEEWRMATYTDYFINKNNDRYDSRVSVHEFSVIANNLNTPNDAIMALKWLDFAIREMGAKMEVKKN